ncbi:MAG: patatin-like phospholipase family protein [Bacteroidota bacterium]
MAKKLGITLSGGGIRGMAHIGVLQALEEEGLSPSTVSGASAGALVGALYAAGHQPKDILKVFKESSLTRLFKVGIPGSGLTRNDYLIEVLQELIPEDNFACLQREFHVSVTNMTTGQYEIKSEGELYRILAASASIPILFNGWEVNQELLVDGGVLNNLPVEPLLGRCYPIIGVNVTPIIRKDNLGGLLDVGYRAFDLVMWGSVEPRLKQCDLVLQPQAQRYALFDVKAIDEIYQLGYETAKAEIPRLKKKMKLLHGSSTNSSPSTQRNDARDPVAGMSNGSEDNVKRNIWTRIKGWFGN